MSVIAEAAAARLSWVTKPASRRTASRSARDRANSASVAWAAARSVPMASSHSSRSTGVRRSSWMPSVSAQIVLIRRTGSGSSGSIQTRAGGAAADADLGMR